MLLKVLSQRNFAEDFIRLKLNFTKKRKKSLFEPHFRGLRGNVRTPSIARSKARGQLSVRCNFVIKLFSLSLAAETLLVEICRSWPFSKGGWVTFGKFSQGRGHRPPTSVGFRKLE